MRPQNEVAPASVPPTGVLNEKYSVELVGSGLCAALFSSMYSYWVRLSGTIQTCDGVSVAVTTALRRGCWMFSWPAGAPFTPSAFTLLSQS
jgi:hypothetical protein